MEILDMVISLTNLDIMTMEALREDIQDIVLKDMEDMDLMEDMEDGNYLNL